MPAETERVIGDFRLERLIARGGVSQVYEARHLTNDRRVALKVIPTDTGEGPNRARLTREASGAPTLDHPTTVPVSAAGERDGHTFVAMRLSEGEDLRQVIDAEGRLPAERVLGIVRQIASALDAAHAQGVVHRDVKPENVMVEKAGR